MADCAETPLTGFTEDTVDVWCTAPAIESNGCVAGPDNPEQPNNTGGWMHARSREQHVAGRAMVRRVLSQYLRCEPDALSFVRDGLGKPAVRHRGTFADAHFSISHSGSLVVCAVSCRPVGVDVEAVSSCCFAVLAASLFLSAQERQMITQCPQWLQPSTILRCWVRKEAYVKGRGVGLRAELPTLTVVETIHGYPLLAVDQADASARWRVSDVDFGDGYVGAVAHPAVGTRIRVMPAPQVTVPAYAR